MSEKENKKDHMTGLIVSMIGCLIIAWLGGWEGGWLSFAAVCGFCLYWVVDFFKSRKAQS
jgi:hypothetical protein